MGGLRKERCKKGGGGEDKSREKADKRENERETAGAIHEVASFFKSSNDEELRLYHASESIKVRKTWMPVLADIMSTTYCPNCNTPEWVFAYTGVCETTSRFLVKCVIT